MLLVLTSRVEILYISSAGSSVVTEKLPGRDSAFSTMPLMFKNRDALCVFMGNKERPPKNNALLYCSRVT